MFIYLKKICLLAKDNNLPIHIAYMIFDYISEDYIKEAQYNKITNKLTRGGRHIKAECKIWQMTET